MSTLGVLLRNEWIKASKLFPARLAVLTFAALLGLTFWGRHTMASVNPERMTFALPGSWDAILGGSGPLPWFFVVGVTVLVIAHEFSSRTARQNVIDGLSKDQLFAAKALLVPLIALLFLALLLAVGGTVALVGRDAPRTEALVRAADLEAMGRFLIGLIGFGSLAFLIAMTARSAGAAMGTVFLYLFIVEQLVLPLLATARAAEDRMFLAYATRWLPAGLFSRQMGDTTVGRRALEALIDARGGSPAGDTALLLAALAWILGLHALAYATYRRRDL